MRVLVATAQTQGARANDYCHATPGELLSFGFTCDHDRRDGPDGACGCMRGMVGLISGKATTTAMVVDREDMTVERLAGEIAETMRVMHWGPCLRNDLDRLAQAEAEELAEVAASFAVGDVLERRGLNFFRKRRPASRKV